MCEVLLTVTETFLGNMSACFSDPVFTLPSGGGFSTCGFFHLFPALALGSRVPWLYEVDVPKCKSGAFCHTESISTKSRLGTSVLVVALGST